MMIYAHIISDICVSCGACEPECRYNCIGVDQYGEYVVYDSCKYYHNLCDEDCKNACLIDAIIIRQYAELPLTPTGVALSSASGTNGNIKVTWNGDPNSSLYEIYRKNPAQDNMWIKIGEAISYSFIDTEHLYAPGWGMYVCTYKVRALNSHGTSTFSSEVSVLAESCG